MTSNMDIAEVRAAMNKRKKNKVPQTKPPGIWGKIVGRATKINPGPASGSPPIAKTVAKIATPAIIAINVSRTITHKDDESRF